MNMQLMRVVAVAIFIALAAPARAHATSDLQAQVQALQRQLEAIKAQLEQVTSEMNRQKQAAEQKQAEAPLGGPLIMGNTGGDNRVEFGLRAAHAIWYESPSWSRVSFKAMYAPGQNRDDTSSIVASAEPDCTGGNVPGSGALPPTCNDGSFGDLYSASLSYAAGPLYLTTAISTTR